jgi:alkanesulfonate monooxygenase SsuD/methylene tetrahydromethanopterin reductase-like flavin-dependent oxidoreductase (luciferase family)
VAHYLAECERLAWQPRAEDVVYRGAIFVADSDADAQAAVERYRIGAVGGGAPANRAVREAIAATGKAGPTTSLLARPAERYVGGPTFCGAPETVLEQVQAFAEAGVGVIDLLFGTGRAPQALTDQSIDLFAHEVLPHLRTL